MAGPPQAVVAPTIGHRLVAKPQAFGRRDARRRCRLALPGQDVEHHVGAAGAAGKRLGASRLDRLQPVLQHRRENLDELPVAVVVGRQPGPQATERVGQAIYRFGGSDIAVMREFGDRFGDFERIDLETTFRCSDRIAGVATDFVLRNPAQIRKTVRATRKGDGPAVHVGLAGDGGLSLLKEALDRIAEDAGRHDGTSEVLLLGRYRHSQPLKSSRSGRPNEMLALSAAGFHPEMKVGIMAWYRPGATPRK